MSTISTEQAKDLRNAFECWQQDYDPVEDKEQYEMFGLGVVAMDELLALRKEREKVVNGGCEKCGGNGSVEIDHGEMGIEHMQCPNCVAKPMAETDTTPQQFESLAGKAVVPDGWRLVPIDPTKDMLRAGQSVVGFWLNTIKCYEAMLAAAPEPCK